MPLDQEPKSSLWISGYAAGIRGEQIIRGACTDAEWDDVQSGHAAGVLSVEDFLVDQNEAGTAWT